MKALRGALLLALALVSVAPGVAGASVVKTNAYGLSFTGKADCLRCHGRVSGRWQVGEYLTTAHNGMVTDVETTPTLMVPEAAKWPSPSYAGGFNFGTADIKWMLGSASQAHQYVTRYQNNATVTIGGGQSMSPIAGPADDYLMPNGVEWDTAAAVWVNGSKTSAKTYFQGCGGCHFLGVTRPTLTNYLLGGSIPVSHTTETSYVGVGIQCETCHGSGELGATGESGVGHWDDGVEIVRSKQVLKSQTCGQCHVNGTAKESNYLGGTFSSPNGFTTDENLRDYFNIYGLNFIKTSPSSEPATIPLTDAKFYPNGSNKKMNHSYYNEWMLSGHARSLHYEDGTLWSDRAEERCLKCHSGEAYLKSINYSDSPTDITESASSIASDTLNIECSICHQTHGSTGDPLGLRISEEKICGTCHNSQIASQELAAGDEVHHPQEEMREGRGLIGVAKPAEKFMGETSCPSCHMPATYNTRRSHSFKVMLPEDAVAWKVPAGGDSCTPCHASLSLTELQDEIDGWTAGIAEATATANAAIAQAESRPASTTTAGAWLIAAAKTNVAYVKADGSRGVHNVPYAMAGLEKARVYANAVGAAFPSFTATRYDTTLHVSLCYGRLVMGDGTPAIGVPVTIEANAAGTSVWTPVGTVIAGANGEFAYVVTPGQITNYRARWTVREDSAAVVSPTATVNIGSTTSIKLSARRIARGRALGIRGSVAPSHAGKAVTVRYRPGKTGTWRKLAVRTLSSTSSYSYTWRPSSRGSYQVRTYWGGDVSHKGSYSPYVTVSVY